MNIFNYESKFNQVVVSVADMIILNILFILCSLPIVTAGAAQAGLFTGLRVHFDREDDSSVVKAFFRGFASGFGTVTIISSILTVLLSGMLYITANVLALYWAGRSIIPLIMCIIALTILLLMYNTVGPFHATFGCTVGQLLRNVFFVAIGNAPRMLLISFLMLVPILLFLIWPHIFMGAVIVLLAFYFSLVYALALKLLKKPFDRLKEIFYASQAEAEGKTEDEAEDEAEEIAENEPEDGA